MLVPDYWAEARLQHRSPSGKQVTVRRFGWSLTSQRDAESMASLRAEDALAQIIEGTALPRREPKVPYNGAEGVPIREEVLSRHGEVAITRNSYGAHCLNTPDCLIADIDFKRRPSWAAAFATWGLVFCAFIVILLLLRQHGLRVLLLALVGSLLCAPPLARLWHVLSTQVRGGHVAIARSNLRRFTSTHQGWGVRLYRTPAGLRLIATHRQFEAREPEVEAFFKAVNVDPLYAVMCRNQNCFRARLTAKPWRVGIHGHMRPRPGVWPVRRESMPRRTAWVRAYEQAAGPYAACRYMETVGSDLVAASVGPVVALHDSESKALVKGAPIA